MVFHWSVSDSQSPQVTRTLRNILTDLNDAVVWMVAACPLISNASSHLNKPLGIFQAYLLQLVSLSPSYSIAFLVLW